MATPLYAWNLRSSGRRVLELPELARIICSTLDQKLYVHLLYVSRNVYASVLPMIWEVALPKSVLLLIPGIEITDHIKFPSVIDLTRLSLHAPFVKTLNAATLEGLSASGEWPEVISKSILPNLQRLVLSKLDGDGVDWISRFLSPSLQMLDMDPGNGEEDSEDDTGKFPWLTLDTYTALFNLLSLNCPLIRTLRVSPVSGDIFKEELCGEAFNRLSNMSSLQSVTLVISCITGELIRALSQLPRLTELSFWTSGVTTMFVQSTLEIPNDSFLSLKRLSMIDLGQDSIKHICTVRPLFRNLTQADIIYNTRIYFTDSGNYKRSVLAVASLGQNTPQLQELAIHPRGWDLGGFVVSLPVINAFKHMHLRRLSLGSISFKRDYCPYESIGPGDGDEITESDSPELQWTAFLGSIPRVEELHLEFQNIVSDRLAWFASLLPKLRLFVFRAIDLGEAPEVPNDKTGAAHPITIRTWSCFATEGSHWQETYVPDEHGLSNAARYIHDLWPKAKVKGMDDRIGRDRPDEGTIARLDVALALSRSADK
ncbi:hypothetical protein FRC12_022030 [Ceratobasidium sp. 428]|nr:hypothetical protein FRC12_022030 [Ceratobasidium sp. 428]